MPCRNFRYGTHGHAAIRVSTVHVGLQVSPRVKMDLHVVVYISLSQYTVKRIADVVALQKSACVCRLQSVYLSLRRTVRGLTVIYVWVTELYETVSFVAGPD